MKINCDYDIEKAIKLTMLLVIIMIAFLFGIIISQKGETQRLQLVAEQSRRISTLELKVAEMEEAWHTLDGLENQYWFKVTPTPGKTK